MKKMYLLAIFIMSSILLCGCSKTSEQKCYPNIILSDSIDNENEITSKIYEDLRPVLKTDLCLKSFDLYIYNEEDYIYSTAKDADVSCSVEDIFNGKYLEDYLYNLLDIRFVDQWKKYAIYSYFYDSEVDADIVKDFLSNQENKDVLSMFPAYYSSFFKSEDEITLNKDIASLYGIYIIDNYGLSELSSCTVNDHINEWLESLDITYSFYDEYADLINDFEYAEEQFYAFTVKTDQNICYYVTPPTIEGNDVFRLRQFLYESYEAVNNILDYIKENAPEYYTYANDNLRNTGIKVYFNEPKDAFYSRPQILMPGYGSFSHEVTHAIIPIKFSGRTWAYEGFASYASIVLSNMSSQKYNSKNNIDRYMEVDRDTLSIPIAYDCYKAYVEKYGILDKDEDLKLYEFWKTIAQVETKYQIAGWDIGSVYDSYLEMGSEIPKDDNTALTYEQAIFFAEYLIDNYTINKFLDYCVNDISFEEVFGTDFDTLLEKWKYDFI